VDELGERGSRCSQDFSPDRDELAILGQRLAFPDACFREWRERERERKS
jgi:hypothetical protein